MGNSLKVVVCKKKKKKEVMTLSAELSVVHDTKTVLSSQTRL